MRHRLCLPTAAAVALLAGHAGAGERPAGRARNQPTRTVPEAFSIPAYRPLRISWPLDVGADSSGRVCLRARQGVNEIQNPGGGWALYAFRVARPGRYRTFCRVRWLDDGVGSVDCNNSWFASLDERSPVCVGNDNMRRGWHWERGPGGRLEAGVHWYGVELREDGVFMDRIAVVPAGADAPPERLETLPVVAFAGLEGLRPPNDPARPVGRVEINVLPTRSVVIGRGHVNELTVLASFCGETGGFEGRVVVESPTSPGLAVEGESEIECAAEAPYARTKLRLRFPASAARRIHRVRIGVLEDPKAGGGRECVFRKTLAFFRPTAWAFLGPFRDPSGGLAGLAQPPAHVLRALARRAPPARLLGKEHPSSPQGASWRLVADGSCYDELGAVDLFRVYGPVSNACCYAVSWLRAETHLNHRSFLFQSDDTASLWMGGRLTAVVPVRLPREANRLWSSAALRRGLNPVVARIAQGGRYWGFRLDVIDWHWQGRRGDVIRWEEPDAWPVAE